MHYLLKLTNFFLLLFLLSCSNFQSTTFQSRFISEERVFLEEGALQEIYQQPAFKKLLKDILFELDHFDGVDPKSEEVVRVKSALESFLSDNDFPKFFSSLDDHWKDFFSLALKPQKIARAGHRVIPTEVKGYERHTLDDLQKYVSNRMGPEVISQNEIDSIRLYIHAGSSSHIGSSFESPGLRLVRIPSLYEKWGIEKYIDLNSIASTRPKVFFNIPPISQYAEHYAKMIGHLNQTAEVRLNLHDREALKQSFDAEVDDLFRRGELKSQAHIVLGYSHRFDQLMNGPLKEWDLLSADEIDSSERLGIRAKVYILKNKRKPDISVRVYAISAETTLWGEGSKFLVEALLRYNPKSLTFLGSAGLLKSESGQYYDSSIPRSFFLNEKVVDIRNSIFSHRSYGASYRVNDEEKIWGLSHTNSTSPTEQTDEWLREQSSRSVGTVDVEVSLIGEAISKYNKEKFANVDFGVINLITGKPALDSETSIDLDEVSLEKKRQSQTGIVRTLLNSLSSYENYIASFDENLTRSILRIMPGVPREGIQLYNGVGKIDASGEHKLSYFIHSENPNSPTGKVVLIPMATSRFDRYNYHTDDWWDEYGDAYHRGERVPFEDPEDVARYLRQNNLSVNPYVIILDDIRGPPKRVRLKDFLLEEYLRNYEQDGFVYLYRGVAKSDEVDVWKSGMVPRSVRYWTPDINYAWRYGRKRNDLISGLLAGRSPMVKFKIPRAEFIEMVRRNQIVLGTELPKSAHRTFENDRFFRDNLTGKYYLGNERFGLELEVRARRSARRKMINYFDGTVSIDELARDRARKIQAAYRRQLINDPHKRDELLKEMNFRLETIDIEVQILKAGQQKLEPELIDELAKKMNGRSSEISHTSRESLVDSAKQFVIKPASGVKSCDSLIGDLITR